MKKTISDITNEQIIQSARRQRQSVNSRMEVEPWKPRHHHGRGIAAIITIATVYQTRIVTQHAKPKRVQPTPTTRQRMLASKEAQESPTPSPTRQSSAEQMACSMLCDDIPYALLATP